MRATHAAHAGADSGVYVSRRGAGGLGDAESLTPRMRRRRAFTLVLLTLLVPGSAQLVAGRRGLGRFALRVWASLAALALVLAAVFMISQSLAIGVLGRGWVLT